MYKVNGIVYFLSFQFKIIYLLYTYYISNERLLSVYFGRIHPKILEFQFSFFFWSHFASV